MTQHKFTIIIPTRNRADVLEWALKTCVEQEYENLEIIISDNFSEDHTKQVVSSYQDKRIKYYNTGKRLSMSHNWEFALSHANDGYISFLGDDDAFLPRAVTSINEILNNHPLDAISWNQSRYIWPNSGFEKNSLFVVMRKGIRIYNGKENLEKVLNYRSHFSTNPWLYGGFVKTELVESIRKKSNGFFFHSRIPDIYSGIAIASQIENYIYSIGPYSIAGLSSYSHGASSFSGEERLRKAHYSFMTEADILPFHPALEFIASSIPLLITESSLQAQDAGLISGRNILSDIKFTIQKGMETAMQKEQIIKNKEMMGFEKTANMHNINWDTLVKSTPDKKINWFNKTKYKLRKKLIGMYIDGNKANINNVYEASLLHEKIYNSRSKFFYNTVRAISELIYGAT